MTICANCKQSRDEHGKTGWCIPLKWHLTDEGEMPGLIKDMWTPIEAPPSPLARVRQEVEKIHIFHDRAGYWIDRRLVLAIIDKEQEREK